MRLLGVDDTDGLETIEGSEAGGLAGSVELGTKVLSHRCSRAYRLACA